MSAINKCQSDGGDIFVTDSAAKPKQTCHFGDNQTTTNATRQCKGCNIDFSLNNSKQSYCSNPCYQKNRPKKPPSAETPINGAGKRNHDALSPVANLDLMEESSNKKAKLTDFDSVVADQDLTQLDTLDSEALAAKLKSLLSFVYQQNDLVKHLEATVANLKTEMEHNKHAFADVIAKSYHAQPRIASPCQPILDMPASKPSYASATRGQPCPVLIANYADGAKPADRVSLATVDQLLGAGSDGPVPQRVRQKDDKLYITLKNPADYERGK
jgi:hypothetical protein